MEEYLIRKKIYDFIQNGVDRAIEEYYKEFEDNIGFLLYYPLINLEMRFIEEDPNFANAIIDREQTTWFIGRIFKYFNTKKFNFSYNKAEFDYFKNTLYPNISKMYSDFRLSEEVRDCNSIAKCKIEDLENNKYKLTTALITNKYRGESFYYLGLDNIEQFQFESMEAIKPAQHLIKYRTFNFKKDIRNIARLKIDVDKELYLLCEKRVNIDTSKLGESIKSKVINRKESLNKLLGFIFYLSQITLLTFQTEKQNSRTYNIENCIMNLDKDWLINKIAKESNLHIELVKKYINYFTYNGIGTLCSFPLIEYNNKIITIPSLIMLNDWQFSITNGHYEKEIEFIKRERNISKSIVENICNSAKKFRNIVVAQERYYEYKNNEKEINSDIDVALYDINTNKVLVIECKWRDNHYSDDTYENYIKIENTLNRAYKEQIDKHKEFFNKGENSIDYVFEHDKRIEDINVIPEIFYIAVDKRSELHLKQYHMTSVYTLLTLFERCSTDEELNLELLINEIDGLRTKVEYFMVKEPKEFIIKNGDDEITIISDELFGEYDL
ncbi:hypothetical protein ACR77J_12100 [Tissierella praeacuta]|uniref:hypothetical protein n=1 Tax=Tissierella praeacuta TaxID=43131 RepID=UPI001050B4DF|nr:hypothetical protein [Tissierella praeacuta]TCU72868.1 hypothetical protein EV204_105204 [Tissierella praeacuta]